MKECDKKIASGIVEDVVDIPDSYITDNTIVWGAISLNCFIGAIMFLCLALLEKLLPLKICIIILVVTTLFLILLNKYLLNKRII